MNDSDLDSDSNTNTNTNTIIKKIKPLMPQRKCENAITGLYIVLFLLVLVLTGNVIQEGRGGGKMVAWALFSLSLILGLIVIVIMIRGTRKKRGKTPNKGMKKLFFPIFSVLIAIMNMVAMIMAKPSLSTKETVTPHIANVAFALVSIMAAILLNSRVRTINSNNSNNSNNFN